MKNLLDNKRSVDITLYEVIVQLDKVTDMVNALVQTVNNLGNNFETGTIKEEVKQLDNKLIAQGDIIAGIIAGDYSDHKVNQQ